MPGNANSTVPAAAALAVRLFAGQRLPFFNKDSSDPNPFSAMDMNRLVAVCNLLLNLKINFKAPLAQSDGTVQSSANITISDTDMAIDLAIAGGDGSGSGVTPMQVVSYSTANSYLVAQMGSFTAANVFTATGATINVALPWELRPPQNPGGASVSPAYNVGDIIFAISTDTGENGVYVSSSELELMDLGVGRTWSTGSGGVNYRGTYNAGTSYNKYDVVRMQTGTSQGVWICVVTGLTAGTAPVWPEPATTGGTNNWEALSLGPITTTDCTGATNTLYINAIQS